MNTQDNSNDEFVCCFLFVLFSLDDSGLIAHWMHLRGSLQTQISNTMVFGLYISVMPMYIDYLLHA